MMNLIFMLNLKQLKKESLLIYLYFGNNVRIFIKNLFKFGCQLYLDLRSLVAMGRDCKKLKLILVKNQFFFVQRINIVYNQT